MSRITIVDPNDNVIGSEARELAMEKGSIRRIVRIFLFDNNGKILLQRRSVSKKVCPNTWDQSAGGHVERGEKYIDSAKRELLEELGIKTVSLRDVATFYWEEGDNDYHFDRIYVGIFDNSKQVHLDRKEVEVTKWFTSDEFDQMMNLNPSNFARGLQYTWGKYKDEILEKIKSLN